MGDTYSLIEQLAKHLQRPVDGATRDRARLHLLDWLACVAGARGSPVHKVGQSAGLDVLTKAAMLGNVLEMDDIHRGGLLHPGPVVWPAALSVSGQGMNDVLDAAVRGYEAMIGVGATLDAYHYTRWHNTATAGAFGAAAAGASLYGLDAERAGWALGNAGSLAGGLWHMRHADVMTKQVHVSHAAFSAVWMAKMAVHGLTGSTGLLEGPQGLYMAMTLDPLPMVLGSGWRMAEVSFKPWAACRHAHPVIDCALQLRAAGRLTPPFHVETYADAIVFCDHPDPETEAQAKFSLQHAIAVIADGREAEPADFTPAAIAALAPLRDQVTVSEANEFTSRYPDHFGARLMAGGAAVGVVDTLGDPERPMSADDIMAKTRTLVAWGQLSPDQADRAIDVALAQDNPAAVIAMLDTWL